MPLTAGTRLGTYEIVAPLGAGGMGEVYRARDPKLDRDVAVKVLPDHLAADPEALTRFEREARSVAALSHPNILAIFEFGQEGRTAYAVTELLEGQTLRDRLAAGALGQRRAVDYALQVARGLAAAHDRGLVHRDLKPENLFVTRDDRVKILDFGLAKPVGPLAGAAATAATGVATAAGMLVGTIGYMAPEQVRGAATDHRADLFAFGTVLYELVTGRRAFGGDTAADTMSAILSREPDELDAGPEGIAPALDRIVRRCLEKDPELRFRSAHDLAFALETLSMGSSRSGVRTGQAAADPHPAPRRVALRAGWALAALMAVLLALSLAFPRQEHALSRPIRFSVSDPVDLAWGRGLTLVPDGSALFYTLQGDGSSQLYARHFARDGLETLKGVDKIRHMFVSPDGRWLAFSSVGTRLRKVSLGDGSITPAGMPELSTLTMGGAWSTDGRLVVSGILEALIETTVAEGPLKTLTTLDRAAGEIAHRWPTFVHGRDAVLFTSIGPGGVREARIDALDLRTRQRSVVVERGTSPLHSTTGHLLFARDDGMFAAPFDAAALRVTGPAVRVLEQVMVGEDGSMKAALSDNGVLAYALPSGSQLVWVDRTGRETPASPDTRAFWNPRLSPDDSRLLFEGDGFIWTLDFARDTYARFADTPNAIAYPIWLEGDQRWIYSREQDLFVGGASIAGGPTSIDIDLPGLKLPTSASPDGRTLLLMHFSQTTSGDVYALPLAGGPPVPLFATPAYEGGAQFSPDGRHIVYVSDEGGRREIYVVPYPARGARLQVSNAGGTHPIWSRDGSEIFYRNGDEMMSVRFGSSGGLSAGRPVRLFKGRYSYGTAITRASYDVARDGRFLMVKDVPPPGGAVRVVVNWFEELRALMGARAGS
jgi:eukaryotic-like serine/threonine-protein kinase